ncbi:hypothetical protein [Hymenobacter rubripertinctus]|uniref:hypothetical protein n=1 Tax=Hymenobacter rubripertinctus TaxID=2029981 RepID=UPI0011C45484|nr:hypothetical protein [Hymenobacter rubripertinctus]
MALTFELQTSDAISFNDFINHASEVVKRNMPETVLDCTEQLQKLSNNKYFLINFLNTELKEYLNFQTANVYSAQTLLLHQTPHYYIRANAWPVMESKEVSVAKNIAKHQNELSIYQRAHDHNFSFLTVGYFGGGYTTEIWEYDNDEVIGFIGEIINLNYLETTKLPKGKSMFYRASKDIHIQNPSDDYSISINVIPISDKDVEKEQYYFDVDTQMISGIVPTVGSGRHMLFDLAKKFHDQKTLDLVTSISENHEIPYMRLKAFDSLSTMTGESEHMWQRASRDNHPIVHRHANLVLEGKKRSF